MPEAKNPGLEEILFPDPLWHYTSAEGVKGILDSRGVRCTNIFYLNDAVEFRHGMDFQIDHLEELKGSLEDPNQEFQALISSLQNYLRQISTRPDVAATYVFSLSTKADQLAQWRAYAGGEGGYAIEFDGNMLDAFVRRRHHLAAVLPCFYDEANRAAMLKKLDELFENIKGNLDEELGGFRIKRLASGSKRLLQWVQAHGSVFKHPYFAEESELRLVRRVNEDAADSVRYRLKGSTLVPYVEVGLWTADEPETCPIRKIMVGPARHQDLNLHAVEGLLTSLGLNKMIEVVRSASPFRGL